MGALRVYKYPLPFPRRDDFALSLPKGATPLTFAFQGNDPFLWALVDPAAPPVDRPFRIAGTGHPICVEGPWQLHYVGTAHLDPDGPLPLVFHLFERAEAIAPRTRPAEPSGAAGGVTVSPTAPPSAAASSPAAPAGVPPVAPAGVGPHQEVA